MHQADQIPSALPAGDRYSAIVESSDDAILSKDRNAIITSWNPGAERLYGYTAEEAIGQRISFLVPEAYSGEEIRILEDILAGRKVDHYETERRRKDGTIIAVSLTISPVRDPDGNIVEASVIARDITARKRLEEERAELGRQQRQALEAVESSREQLAFAARASALLAESLDLEKVLHQLADAIVPRIADWCMIDLLADDGSYRSVAVGHREPDQRDLLRRLRQRHPTDPTSTESAVAREMGAQSSMVLPLSVRGRVRGALTLGADEPGRYAGDDGALARDLAYRTALAVDNSLLYRREHEAAATLQRSLLPTSLPDIPGVAFAARYLPASEGIDVGGDWYDAIALDEGHVGVIIGDVAGRGLRAASVMGQLRNALRAYAIEGHDAAGTVERLDFVCRSLEEPDMTTLVYLDFDREHNRVSYVRAGHLAPMVRGRDGTVRRLEGVPCLPVGVAPTRYEAAEATLEPEETLLLFTDGLVETRGRSIDYDLAQLEEVLRDGPDDAEALADHVVERMLADRAQEDDVALLVVRPVPAPLVLRLKLPAEPGALTHLRRALGRWLRDADATADESFDVTLASSEAAANAIEHAYGPGDAEFEVEAQVDGSNIEVHVRDRGRWREPRGTDRGRGLQIMEATMDRVQIDTGERGTHVRMRRRLAGAVNGTG